MSEGWTTELMLLAFCVGACCALIAARDLPLWASVVLAAIRVGVPLVYFAEYFEPSWTIGDDLIYFAHGNALLGWGYNPLSVLVDPEGWNYLHSLSRGHHVLYAWWNLLAVWLCGSHYYAAVFFNVLATFVGGSFLVRILRQLNLGGGYATGLLVFWLLHWDVIAWSSFLNVKDVLVQTLTIAMLYCLVSYLCQRRLVFLVALAATVQLFWWIRFYVPIIMLTAVMLWMLTQWNDARKYLLIPLGGCVLYFAAPLISEASNFWDYREALFGAVRFSLTPTPWSIHEVYSYLWWPTVLHWAFFLPALVGAAYLWNESPLARLFLIYLACLVGIYAMTQELLGARQRFQATFLFAWAQFHFVWTMRPKAALSNVADERAGWHARPWPVLADSRR